MCFILFKFLKKIKQKIIIIVWFTCFSYLYIYLVILNVSKTMYLFFLFKKIS
jgi:hypothetical protein